MLILILSPCIILADVHLALSMPELLLSPNQRESVEMEPLSQIQIESQKKKMHLKIVFYLRNYTYNSCYKRILIQGYL